MSRSVAAIALLLLVCAAQLVDALVETELLDVPLAPVASAAAACAVGVWAAPRSAAAAATAGAVQLTWANQLRSPGEYPLLDDLVFFMIITGGPALVGAALGARTRQVAELRRLATMVRAQRQVEARAAQLEERNRIAAELHRGFSEQLSAVVMRIEGVQGASSEEVRLALADVEAAARTTLDELRSTLGTLREPVPSAAPERKPGPPPPARPVGRDDLLLALGCGVAVAIEAVVSPLAQGPAVANAVAGLAVGVPMAVRRGRPVTAAVGTVAVLSVMSRWLTPPTEMVTTLVPMLVVAYSLGARAKGVTRYAGAALLFVGAAALVLVREDSVLDVEALVGTSVFLGVGLGAGIVVAGWSARAEQQRRAVAELEHGRGAELQRAVAEERGRRAHELHDTIAHAMTVVCLQAGAGQVAGPVTGPGAGPGVLDVVLDTSRQALSELRHGLDRLGDQDALAPERLRAEAHAAGLRPEVVVTGDLGTLPPAVRSLAARVTREALTNAGRYAPGARVLIDVTAGARLEITIRDVGAASKDFAHGSGTGLEALAEELARSGGRLDWGPDPDGGWLVHATLDTARVPA